MRYGSKRILSAALSVLMLSCMIPSAATGAAAMPLQAPSAVSQQQTVSQAMDNIQEGTILHCFDWKYQDIIDELPNIAEAGFTAIQTSPAQPGGNNDPDAEEGTWWWLYQPLRFSVGKNYLGDKDDLTELCDEAHKYGIKIIVDIVANHLAGDHTNIQEDLKPSEYWHAVEDWNNITDKRYKTTHKDLGMPDIASEHPYVIQCVKNYVQELKGIGVDGLRWDTLKHIQVPSEDCAFFTDVLDPDMYNYGESLSNPGGNNDTQNKDLMVEYTGLMSVTDDSYGYNLTASINSGNAPTTTGNWANRGISASKLVYWGESHDTYSNHPNEGGTSKYISQSVIDRSYAIAASRSGATALYFSRPSEKEKDLIHAGVKGSTHFTDPEVAEVNIFHNVFNEQSEKYSTYDKIAYTERGTKGILLVNAAGGSVSVNVPVYKMVDGTYTDHVTGNTFTVANGKIKGTIGSTGIAVVYNDGDTDEPHITKKTLYLKPNDNWTTAGARFAMYLFNGSGNQWVSMTDTDGDGTYEAAVPKGNWTNVIFCRMNGSTTVNKWDNKWNQTADLFPDENTDRYSVAAGVWDEGNQSTGTWDLFGHECEHQYGEPQWIWENDHSGASAKFVCTECDDEQFEEADISVSYVSNIRVHTASVTFDEYTYEDVKYEAMVTQENLDGESAFITQNAEALAKLYQRIIDQPVYGDNITINVYDLNIPSAGWDFLCHAFYDCFPEDCMINPNPYKQPFNIISYSNMDGKIYEIDIEYSWTKEKTEEMISAFYDKADEYLALLTPDMDDLTKAIVIHDKLVLDHYYQIESDTEYSSNYTFMLDGWGRCENYAESYAFILARAGIKSEIVSSSEINHEWLMICLGGKYYHVDVTWDDPLEDRPHKVSHKYFLLSDTKVQDSGYARAHTGYTAVNAASSDYDDYNNLHTNNNPIFFIEDGLWTVYTKQDTVNTNLKNGVLAVYDPDNDFLVDFEYDGILPITDRWSAGGNSYWRDNYTSLAEYDGVLYLNGEHTVYAFDPELSIPEEFVTYNDHQLYGIYIKDGVLYGLSADNPNDDKTAVVLHAFVVPQTYTVTWKNWDGNVLETDTDVPYGSDPSYDGADPTRESTAQYDYTFSGWTPEISAVTGDVTYTATFTETARKYTITWLMDDGSTIDTTSVEYGTLPTHDDPVKASDKRYTYTFTGWTPAVAAVTGEATYTAQFTATEITYYLVGTMNGWSTDENYAFVLNEGCTSTLEYMLTGVQLEANAEFKVQSSEGTWFARGNTPNDTVDAAGTYDIYFRPNWDGSSTWYYGAIYANNVTPYTVEFVSEGEILQTSTVLYGKTPVYTGADPEKEADNYYTYTFSGWSPEISKIYADTTYTAQFTATEKTVTITYVDFNGVETVNTVGMASFSTETFTLKSPYLDGYTLNGWRVNGNECSNKDDALAEISSLVASGTPVEITPIYTNKDETHTVHVLGGGKLSNGSTFGTFKPAKQLFVNAPETADGKVFDRWEISLDEQSNWFTVGYDLTYAFRMPLKNVYLRSVYVNSEADKTERKGIAYIENYYKSADGAISFVAVLTVPEDATMLRGGIVACKLSDLDDDHTAPSIDYARFKRFTETEEIGCSSLKYTWTKSNIKDGDTWCVCAYLLYRDVDGEHTVYSSMVSAKLSDFNA